MQRDAAERMRIRLVRLRAVYNYGHCKRRRLFTTAGALFNEGGVDADFRVESDTVSDAFTVDGASGTVAVNGTAFSIGNHTGSFNQDGTYISNSSGSFMYMERSGAGNSVMYIHRRTDDGVLVEFFQGGTSEGEHIGFLAQQFLITVFAELTTLLVQEFQ
jgi:hypothetical protein